MSDEHENPTPTVDAIIEVDGGVVVIERKNPPLGVAFPGGFVDLGERLEDACIREAREETSLDIELVALLGVYSDPRRDPRLHTCSAVYVGCSSGTPRAADDAKAVRIVALDRLAEQPFVFDHALIARDYLRWRRTGQVAPLRPSTRTERAPEDDG